MIDQKLFIFDKDEDCEEEALNKAMKIIDTKTGIIRSINRTTLYNDEPPFFHYKANMCDTSFFSEVRNDSNFPGGASFNRKKALIKTLGEAIERYCLGIYQKKKLIRTSPYKLENNALNLELIVNFSKKQLKKNSFKIFHYNKKTEFNWIKGYHINKKRSIFIPAQLIYVPYYFVDEPIIRFPISTGAASGTSLSGALYRGICEIIEREAFMINYLNMLPRKKINVRDDKIIKKILKKFKDYRLSVNVFDISSDIHIYTFLAILIDESERGNAVTLGLKTSFNPKEAFIGSIEEALPIRCWMRDLLSNKPNIKKIEKNQTKIITFEERGLLWSQKSMIKKLDFLLKNRKTENLDELKDLSSHSSKENLKKILNILLKKKLQVFFVDITTRDIEQVGFKVVKVVIPQMHPFYVDERFKYLGGDRLYNVPKKIGYKIKNENELNKIPHPFL
ncbi:MAG: YcaO-like family protein [Promethearchaeota archaeon]